jgi:hypothetical protein
VSSREIRAADLAESCATREAGAKARAAIIALLNSGQVVQIDFDGLTPTPSFADEFVGKLAQSLGVDGFRSRVRIVNTDLATRNLLREVVARRTAVHETA